MPNSSQKKKVNFQLEKDSEPKETDEQISDKIRNIMVTLLRLQNQFSVLESDLANKVKRLEAKAIGQELKIEELEQRIQTLETSKTSESNGIADTNTSLACELAVKKIELENVKNNIVLRGVGFHKALKPGDKEGAIQTRQVVDDIFKYLEINVEGCYEATRLVARKDIDTSAPIIVKFWTQEGKRIFYRQLAKKKPGTKSELIKNLKISDEIPNFLFSDYRRAEASAYNFRKQNQGGKTKTRINYKTCSIILLVKKAEDLEFQGIPF